MNAPQELLKQYVQSQNFTSTADIMAAIDLIGCRFGMTKYILDHKDVRTILC